MAVFRVRWPSSRPTYDEAGHTWHHSDNLLFDYTKLGVHKALSKLGVKMDSGMPDFCDQLSDDDILDGIAFIKSTSTERIWKFHEERTKLDKQRPD